MLHAQAPRQAGEPVGAVADAVVGQHMGEADAQAAVVAHGLEQRAARAAGALVGFDAAEGKPGMIVDGDVDVFPAGARDLYR